MIKIRFKPLKSGGYSVYLDDYEKGNRSRKFLSMQVSKDYSKSRYIAKEDIEVMTQVHQLVKDLSEHKADNVISSGIEKIKLIEFIKIKFSKKSKYSSTVLSLIKHIKIFTERADIAFTSITEKWISDFTEYLQQTMKESTINGLLSTLKLILNEAVDKGYIKNNVLSDYRTIHFIKKPEYLTNKEIKLLQSTETSFNPQINQAFFFSLHTGLTWLQVSTLTWEQITQNKQGDKLITTVKVNGSQNHAVYENQLSAEALEILRELTLNNSNNVQANVYWNSINVKKNDSNVNLKTDNVKDSLAYVNNISFNVIKFSGKVFNRLPNKSNCNLSLRLWGAMAGLNKSLCFSMARHSYAINLIENGADNNTLKRLLNYKRNEAINKYNLVQVNNSNDTSTI